MRRGRRQVAIAIEDGRMEMAIVRSHGDDARVESIRTVALATDDLEGWISGFQQLRPPRHHPLVIGLPLSRLLVRVLPLPAGSGGEWRAMAHLNAEVYSPFPPEEVQLGSEKWADSTGGGWAGVFFVRRDLLQMLGEACRRVHLWPERLDVNLLGFETILRASEPEDTGRSTAVLLRLQGGVAEWCVSRDRVPVAIGGAPVRTPGELREALADVWTTLAWEFGITEVHAVDLWVDSADVHRWPESETCQTVPPGGPTRVRWHHRSGGAAEGLAIRALRARAESLDLAPAEWKSARDQHVHRRAAVQVGASLVGLWLVTVAGFTGGLSVQRSLTARSERELEQRRQPAEAALAIRERVRALEQYFARSHSALEALREIVRLLPPGIELTSFSYRKDGTVALRGVSDQAEAIYDYLEALDRSEFFDRIESGDLRSRMVGGLRKSEFTVTAYLPSAGGRSP